MTPAEIDARATTAVNIASLATKLPDGPEKLLIMRIAASLTESLDEVIKPRFLMDMETGKIIPLTPGGKQ